MTPYYDDGQSIIYHGDCRDVLQAIESTDLVLTSPPYNLSEGGRQPGGALWSALDGGYESYSDDMPHDAYVEWQRSILSACWAMLPQDGAIFYQHKPILRDGVCRLPFDQIPEDALLRQIVTWDRMGGFSRSPRYFVPNYEWLLVLARPDFRLTSLVVPDVWRIPSDERSARADRGWGHPASFPLRLARQVIEPTAAMVVLDPFMGSGTTLRAAKDLGRRGVGIDISERYCEIAANRLAQEVLAL